MRDAAPQTIYLADYTPYGFIIDDVALHFDLDPRKTRVKSRISFRPNPDASDKTFFLHGENLSLVSAMIDGTPVSPEVTPQGLTCDVPDAPFVWEAEVEIDPMGNTALEGATIMLLSHPLRATIEKMARTVEHIELETTTDFFDIFVDGCMFNPMKNLSAKD